MKLLRSLKETVLKRRWKRRLGAKKGEALKRLEKLKELEFHPAEESLVALLNSIADKLPENRKETLRAHLAGMATYLIYHYSPESPRQLLEYIDLRPGQLIHYLAGHENAMQVNEMIGRVVPVRDPASGLLRLARAFLRASGYDWEAIKKGIEQLHREDLELLEKGYRLPDHTKYFSDAITYKISGTDEGREVERLKECAETIKKVLRLQ